MGNYCEHVGENFVQHDYTLHLPRPLGQLFDFLGSSDSRSKAGAANDLLAFGRIYRPRTSRPVAWAKRIAAMRRSICASTTLNRDEVRSVSASVSSTLEARPF